MEKLVFDTLKYAKMLTGAGIEYGDIHAESLATALSQNVYTKGEVDKMIEDALRRSDENFKELEKQIVEIKAEMSRMFNRYTIATITILGGLIALFTFIEHFIR